MIFEIDATQAQLHAFDPILLSRLLTEVLRAHRLGHHLVIMPRQTSLWFLANVQLGLMERATVERLVGEFTQTGSLRDLALERLRIVGDHVGPPVSIGNAVHMSFEEASNLSLSDKSILLVEDTASDGRLYVAIFDQLKRRVGTNSISMDVHHGGGERIIEVLAQRIGERRIVCMLADSDRNAPSSPEPAKISDARKLAEDAGWPLVEAVALPCREIENLIPLSIVRDLQSAKERGAEIKVFTVIEDAEAKLATTAKERFWLFVDLKSGLSDEQMEKLSDDERTWVVSRLAMAGSARSYRGFGNTIVSQVLASNAAMAALSAQIRREDWWARFEVTFARVLWFLMASRRQFL